MDLEGSGAPFGRGLGRVLGGVWRLWRPRGSFFGVVFSCLYLGWSSKALLEGSGLDFASILRGLGGISGGIWAGFGSDFKGFGVILDFSWIFCVIGARPSVEPILNFNSSWRYCLLYPALPWFA